MTSAELHERVAAARRAHKVPGVSAAFLADGQIVEVADGVANAYSGVPMTTHTLAHIGSITKLMTATLVMQLVDEGQVDLGRRVIDYLPSFRIADHSALPDITVEMLLNHTCGMGGNLLPDRGHDEETLVNTVKRFADEAQVHRPGKARSYCNAGTVVAGYLCQQLTGESWYDLVKSRIFSSLHMECAATLPEEALLHNASVGHFLDGNGENVRTSHAFLPLGYAPAGSTTMCTARDLLEFVSAHLRNGAGADGGRLLSSENTARMQRFSGAPEYQAFESGIGWRIFQGLIGHGGGGPGIVSYVSADPRSGTAAAVLTNAEHGVELLRDVLNPFMLQHAGAVPLPTLPQANPACRFEPDRYVGVYENNTVIHEVRQDANGLVWTAQAKHKYYDSSPIEPTPVQLVPVKEGWFLSRTGLHAANVPALVGFLGADEGTPAKYLAEQLWLYPRTN
ncbi:MAG TPA: serine hydrolase domain-containing protein [Candidatus Baltobacteraceae bacterium]|jgi:CubicO group peptidase (beta-lactamase class C family)|nr:serine hydrolase domain-containing protein [Candidatus Baltobacteraceae bacterium]